MTPILIEIPRTIFDTLTVGTSRDERHQPVVTLFVRDARVTLDAVQCDALLSALQKARGEL